MYANQLGSQVGKLDLRAGTLVHDGQSVPMIDAIATVDESGRLWSIALVNRHPSKNAACTVKMKDTLLDGRYEATILAGDSPDAFNDVEHPDRVVPETVKLRFTNGVAELPPHSLTIVKVPPQYLRRAVVLFSTRFIMCSQMSLLKTCWPCFGRSTTLVEYEPPRKEPT